MTFQKIRYHFNKTYTKILSTQQHYLWQHIITKTNEEVRTTYIILHIFHRICKFVLVLFCIILFFLAS